MNKYLKINDDYYKEVTTQNFVPKANYYGYFDKKTISKKRVEKLLVYKPKNNTNFDHTSYIVSGEEILKNVDLWFIQPKIPNYGDVVYNERGKFEVIDCFILGEYVVLILEDSHGYITSDKVVL